MTLQLLNRQQEKPDHGSENGESGTGAAGRQEGSPGAKTEHEEPLQHSPAQSTAPPAEPGEAARGSLESEQEGQAAPHPARPRAPEEEQGTQSSGVTEEEKVQEEHLPPTAESSLDPEKGPVLAGQAVPGLQQRLESIPIGKADPEHGPSAVPLQAEAAEPSVPEAKPGGVDEAALPAHPAVEQKAEEAVGGLEPPPLNGEDGSGTDPWDGAASVSSTAQPGSAVLGGTPGSQELGSSPRHTDSR